MGMIDRADMHWMGRTAPRGVMAALVAAITLALLATGLLVAPPAHALTGTINSFLPATSAASPWNIPFKTKLTPSTLTASGGPATFTVSPALPAGILLTSTGDWSGTANSLAPPTKYTITASDGGPQTVTMDLWLAVVPTAIAPGTIFGTVNQPLGGSPTLIADGFATPTYFFNPPLPWPVTIDPKFGTISATPTTSGQFSTVVTITDGPAPPQALSATATLNFNISAAPLTPGTQTATATVGTALAPSTAAFPAGSYAISPDVNAATGLTFSPTTGQVSGTATKPVGATVFTINKLDPTTSAVLGTSTLSLTVDGFLGKVAAPIKVAAGADIGSVVPFGPGSALAAGLNGTATFSIAPALPTGLFLDANTGVITGAPVAAGSRDYTVTATDGTGAKATGTVTISVTGALLPATQTINGSVATSLSSSTMSITGMKAPITFSISPTPPGGLQFDATTGVLSGIPTVPIASTSYRITASDSTGASSTATLNLTVVKTTLTVPVIGSVTGGTQPGSIIVYFARPSGAPAGQTYTVKVFDATGSNLVTSVTTTTTPATVTGLVPGLTYSVIVAAGGTDGFDPVESLPRTGTATSSTGSQAVTVAAAGTVPTSTNFTSNSQVSTLADAGIVLATGSKAAKATKAYASHKPKRKLKKSEKIKLPLDTFVSVVIPNVKIEGQIEVQMRIKRTWFTLGFVSVDKDNQLILPALKSSEAGKFPIKLKPPVGKVGYVRLLFKDSSTSSSDTSSSSDSGSSSAGF